MLQVAFLRMDPAYRHALAQCGLARVEQILCSTSGRVAAWSRTTDTLFVPGCDGPGFYVKRHFFPTWSKRWRGTLRGTTSCLREKDSSCRVSSAALCADSSTSARQDCNG